MKKGQICKSCSPRKKILVGAAALFAAVSTLTGCASRLPADSSGPDTARATQNPSVPDENRPGGDSGPTQTADTASGSGRQPDPGSTAAPDSGSASAPDSGSTSAPDSGSASAPAPGPTSAPTPEPTSEPTPEPSAELSFLETHGALSVNGTDLVDRNGEKIQLYGVSTHGLAWFPDYVNEESFKTLHEDWGINCVRLALYTEEYGGYCSGGDRDALKTLVKNGISYATSQDMYVIVDWHILHDQDPNVHKEDAIAFFREMSEEYADAENIIYEICNEPNGYANWDSVKSYAEKVIPVIRENDEDAVILVGSPTWSQDIDKAAASPLEFDNVMYTLHFYAATHRDDLRSRLKTCVDGGLPVFISEFGTCDASGNGANDFDQTSAWMELIEEYNLSFFSWNLSNKAESSSLISSSCSKTSGWTEEELSDSGKWLRNYMRGKSQ